MGCLGYKGLDENGEKQAHTGSHNDSLKKDEFQIGGKKSSGNLINEELNLKDQNNIKENDNVENEDNKINKIIAKPEKQNEKEEKY